MCKTCRRKAIHPSNTQGEAEGILAGRKRLVPQEMRFAPPQGRRLNNTAGDGAEQIKTVSSADLIVTYNHFWC